MNPIFAVTIGAKAMSDGRSAMIVPALLEAALLNSEVSPNTSLYNTSQFHVPGPHRPHQYDTLLKPDKSETVKLTLRSEGFSDNATTEQIAR